MNFDSKKTRWMPVVLVAGLLIHWQFINGRAVAQSYDTFSNVDIEFFENKVRPLLVLHCLECHGDDAEKIRGGLRLTSRDEMLTGGESGAAVVPGQPGESLLIDAVQYGTLEMPPVGKLPANQIEILTDWIQRGVPDPRKSSKSGADNQSTGSVTAEQIESSAANYWAFQSITSPAAPMEFANRNWPISDIDRFILARLEQAQLAPTTDTDRATLLRRVYLALIGLPPSESEIEAFTDSSNPIEQDLENVVDKLLASTHFGERWGRHWLDVARFAESSGGGRSLMFPLAWRYRDYVIESFNRDKPFDQFVREQIAGDLLLSDSRDQQLEQIVGSGFLTLGPTNYEEQDKERLRLDVIDEQVDTIGRAFLSLTLGCARCHDHKFDPIPTRDYYALAGIFGNTETLVAGNVSSYVTRSLATRAQSQAIADYRKKVTTLSKKLEQATNEVKRLGGTVGNADQRADHQIAIDSLPGIVIDDADATLTGQWKPSVSVPIYVGAGYRHDDGQIKGKNQAVFSPQLENSGEYEVRIAWSPGGNRASNVPVTIQHQDGIAKLTVNQSETAPIEGVFKSLGQFRFEADSLASVTISNEDTDGVVIIDAVQFLPVARNSRTPLESTQNNAAQDNSPAELPSVSKQKSATWIAAEKLRDELDRQLKDLKKQSPPEPAISMSIKDTVKCEDGPIHIRGEVRNLGEVVPRGFLQVLCQSNLQTSIPSESSGRLQLADWIASPLNPLTARVYANRVWRQLFGTGLVRTTDNFGVMGELPSHPELLDFLARQLIDEGWSTKKLIREIVMSHVFRLSTVRQPVTNPIDPGNRLLAHFPLRRLDAESLRDSILSVSDQLDLTAGGLTIDKLTEYDSSYDFKTNRRSVYVPAFRNSMLDFFEVFDIANPNLVVGDRTTSTLPTQALFLMNSPFVIQQSRFAAQRLIEKKADKATETTLNESDTAVILTRLKLAYLRAIGREPTKDEARLSLEYLGKYDLSDPAQQEDAWASLFHTLFASLDFRYCH